MKVSLADEIFLVTDEDTGLLLHFLKFTTFSSVICTEWSWKFNSVFLAINMQFFASFGQYKCFFQYKFA